MKDNKKVCAKSMAFQTVGLVIKMKTLNTIKIKINKKKQAKWHT